MSVKEQLEEDPFGSTRLGRGAKEGSGQMFIGSGQK
jgi:hypothetical protein